MNAIVVEIKDGFAAVMTDDGQFIKVKDQSYDIGMSISLDDKKAFKEKSSKVIQLRALAFSAAAILLIFIGIRDFLTPYSVISLDVNPSIEMSVNRYNIVLDITAVNDDAEDLVTELKNSGIPFQTVETVVRKAMNEIADGVYEADDGVTYVMMSAESENTKKAEKLAGSLETIGQEIPNVSLSAIAADEELLERAHESGTTAGKMYLVDCLKEASGDEIVDENVWLNKPVRDILAETNRVQKEPNQDVPKNNISANESDLQPTETMDPKKLEDENGISSSSAKPEIPDESNTISDENLPNNNREMNSQLDKIETEPNEIPENMPIVPDKN